MPNDHNVRGRKANKEQRAVDAPRRFITAPAHLPEEVRAIFDECARRMPPGFFTPAHIETLTQVAGSIKIVRDLEKMVYAPDFPYLVTGSMGSPVINPILREHSKQKTQLLAWLSRAKLSPSATYPSAKAVPNIDVEEEPEETTDPRLQRLRSIV